jgi:hypothetical protein
MKHCFLILSFLIAASFQPSFIFAQSENDNSKDFQIFLKQPAKSIQLLMYEKNFTPIQGTLSKDKKSIIIKNYEKGSKVRVKVQYEDGTVEEFLKSPCYIDPVIS